MRDVTVTGTRTHTHTHTHTHTDAYRFDGFDAGAVLGGGGAGHHGTPIRGVAPLWPPKIKISTQAISSA